MTNAFQSPLPAFFRLGRCLADTERIISLPRPVVGIPAFARATARANNAFTSGRSKTVADSSRRKRVCLPEPERSLFGSGRLAPCMKHRPTPFEAAAIEKTQSEG